MMQVKIEWAPFIDGLFYTLGKCRTMWFIMKGKWWNDRNIFIANVISTSVLVYTSIYLLMSYLQV